MTESITFNNIYGIIKKFVFIYRNIFVCIQVHVHRKEQVYDEMKTTWGTPQILGVFWIQFLRIFHTQKSPTKTIHAKKEKKKRRKKKKFHKMK